MLTKLIPKSLFVRFILILVLPIIFAQSIATYIFYNRHWFSVSKNMSYSLANDIQVALSLERDHFKLNERRQFYANLNLSVTALPYKITSEIKDFYDPDGEFLYKALKRKFDLPIQIEFIDHRNYVKVEIFQDDTVYSFIADSKRVDNPTTYIFIMWMTGASLIFLLLAIVFARNQIRPIIKLARAADRFGKGQQYTNLKPEGASEIRKASVAFLKMKERIERQISHRTEMLAGISHDLRTPLTRMRLQIALNPEMAIMNQDIKDMEEMINAYLDFARGDRKEPGKMISLDKLIKNIVGKYKNLTIKEIPHIKLLLKIDSMKRALQNLFDNAFKYASKAIVNSYIVDDELFIEIHDDGPGIPPEQREEVFKPFYRLDSSRNRETGGVGLGLAITRDLISTHGGVITLAKSELLNGLKVIIILPL